MAIGVDGDTSRASTSGGAAARSPRLRSSQGWRRIARRRSFPPGLGSARETRRSSPARSGARWTRRAPSALSAAPARAPPSPWRPASGRQRITRSTSASSARLAATSLRASPVRLFSCTSARPARRSRMPSPVVPASPSMKIRAAMMRVFRCRARRVRPTDAVVDLESQRRPLRCPARRFRAQGASPIGLFLSKSRNNFMSQPLRVGIAGLGTVGAAVLGVLGRRETSLAERAGRAIAVTGVSRAQPWQGAWHRSRRRRLARRSGRAGPQSRH